MQETSSDMSILFIGHLHSPPDILYLCTGKGSVRALPFFSLHPKEVFSDPNGLAKEPLLGSRSGRMSFQVWLFCDVGRAE